MPNLLEFVNAHPGLIKCILSSSADCLFQFTLYTILGCNRRSCSSSSLLDSSKGTAMATSVIHQTLLNFLDSFPIT
ncbi:hypothetical protein TcWFU_002658 [Taenia crassiceps]|uniref:Uncharacterized protein n=1 Tax=Taenia crassiceps TaxID=6207 RepID=A0ABR4QK20_9CEST